MRSSLVWKNCEVHGPEPTVLTVLANSPKVRCTRDPAPDDASAAPATREPDVDEGRQRPCRGRSPARARSPSAGRRRDRVPRRCCAGHRRGRRSDRVRRRAPCAVSGPRADGPPSSPTVMLDRCRTTRAMTRRPRAGRSRAARPRRAPASPRRGQSVVRISGRPSPAVMRRRPSPCPLSARRRRARAPPTTPARSAGAAASIGGVSGGTRSGASPAVPLDSRGSTTSPSPRDAWSMAIASRPSRTSKSTAWRCLVDGGPATPPTQLDPHAPEHERPMRLVLELVLGVDAALDRDEPGRPVGQRPRLGDRDDRGHREDPADAEARSERAEDRDPDGERDQAHGDRDQGCHGGDYTRCSGLPRAWKGPKEPPRHVGVDAISAVSIVRPLRADRYATGAARAGSTAVVHECSSAQPSYPPLVHSGQAVHG